MTREAYTPHEAAEARHYMLRLARDARKRPTRVEYDRLQSYLTQQYAENGLLRDAFGLHPIVTALQTACIAAEEISLHGHALEACLLRAAVRDEQQLVKAEQLFGADVAAALRAYQRAEALLNTKPEAMETDNFRNLFVSQCGDMRVILLLIADCLNRMRQVRDTSQKEAQRKLSIEAAYVYAPLAHKLGLYTIKSELEDLSLKYLEHDAYYLIKEKLNATKASRDAYIARFIAPLKDKLDAEGLTYHIKGRTKSIHSIWQKMKKQHCDFEGVYDLFAIRIILAAPPAKEKALCWKVFSLITYEYESNLKRLRDWLTVPKSNGYESLHITVRGPEDKWVEVQIRTERMDEIAEHGLAAHWRYKGIRGGDGGVDAWLSGIRAALEQGDEARLSKSLNADLHEDVVYVFSPKGDLYKLPRGSTVLDFAYLIHTNIGNHCVGGRINGKNVSMRHVLESGQTVEINTSNQQTPKAEWVTWVASPRARAKIRAAVNDLQSADSNLAREILERKLKNRKLEWNESAWNQLIKKLGYKEATEFYRDIATGRLDVGNVISQYTAASGQGAQQQEHTPQHRAEEYDFEKEKEKAAPDNPDVLVIGKDLKGINFQMSPCCNPVYGDDVFGFVTVSGTIKIHRETCPNAPALRSRFPYRIVKARWAGKGSGKYAITLRVVGNDDLGIVNNITSVIAKEEQTTLRSINIDSNDGLFSGILTVLVDDTNVLGSLVRKLRAIKGVKAVSRS